MAFFNVFNWTKNYLFKAAEFREVIYYYFLIVLLLHASLLTLVIKSLAFISLMAMLFYYFILKEYLIQFNFLDLPLVTYFNLK